MSKEPSRNRPSVVLLVGLLAALAIGAAASLLIGSMASSGHRSPVAPSELIVPNAVLTYALFGVLVFFVLWFVIGIAGGGRKEGRGLLQRPVLALLMVLMIAVVFIVAARAFYGGGPLPSGAVPNGSNSTGLPPPGPSQGNGTNASNVGGLVPFLLPGIPGWATYGIVVAVIVILAVVAVPLLRSASDSRRLARRSTSDRDTASDGVQEALTNAAADLEGGRDPRSVITRLYGELLTRLQPVMGRIDFQTPDEIRILHLERLGIRPAVAERLTRLFEEARYSTHRLGEDSVLEARSAIAAALADFSRSGGS